MKEAEILNKMLEIIDVILMEVTYEQKRSYIENENIYATRF